jgi:hypothetical protein
MNSQMGIGLMVTLYCATVVAFGVAVVFSLERPGTPKARTAEAYRVTINPAPERSRAVRRPLFSTSVWAPDVNSSDR